MTANSTHDIDKLALHELGLARKAAQLWGGGSTEPILLKRRENAIFRIELHDGKSAALRLHRPQYHSDVALLSELQWMAHLKEQGFWVPEPLLTSQGLSLAIVSTPELPEPRQVDCLSWIEGTPLGYAGVPLGLSGVAIEQIFEALGATLGRMHGLAQSWTQPPDFNRHCWNISGFFGPTAIWGDPIASSYLDKSQHCRVAEAREKAVRLLNQFGSAPDRFGIIHADLARENILISDTSIRIIDFDDCGFGWFMYDLAVALYPNRREPLYPVIRQSLLKGYRSARKIVDDELLLPLFLALRAFALIGWIETRGDDAFSANHKALVCSNAYAVIEEFLEQEANYAD
jgi:Ser/Thr protein kinase RdoA (MazF antagonist)